MHKIREVLWLKEEAGLSNRVLARECKITNSTVGEYVRGAQKAGLHWPLVVGISDDNLYRKLFPEEQKSEAPERALTDWETIRKELKKKGRHT